MTEQLFNHESPSESPLSTEWDSIGDEVKFNGRLPEQIDESEQFNQLTAPADVLDNVKKFTIRDGKVYDSETHVEITDDNTITMAKASRFLFDQARAARDEASQRGGNFIDRGPSYYVDKAMEKFAARGEDAPGQYRNMVNALVRTGSYEENIVGAFGERPASDFIQNSAFNIFYGEDSDNARAYLRQLLRQNGQDIDQVRFSHNDTEKASGVLKFKMEVTQKPYRMEVSPEEYQRMSEAEKQQYFKIKMREAKILGDREEYDYWLGVQGNHT